MEYRVEKSLIGSSGLLQRDSYAVVCQVDETDADNTTYGVISVYSHNMLCHREIAPACMRRLSH